MKKILFFILLMTSYTTSFSQEKVYSTRSGVISFFSSTPAEKIEAINSQVTCKMSDKSGQIAFILLIKGFTFENALMQEHFNENYMESSKFSKADFKGIIKNIAEVNFSKDGIYKVTVDGNLTIHGVTNKVTTLGTITIASSKVIATAAFNIKVKDYGITGKYIGEKIANEVETTVTCKFD